MRRIICAGHDMRHPGFSDTLIQTLINPVTNPEKPYCRGGLAHGRGGGRTAERGRARLRFRHLPPEQVLFLGFRVLGIKFCHHVPGKLCPTPLTSYNVSVSAFLATQRVVKQHGFWNGCNGSIC